MIIEECINNIDVGLKYYATIKKKEKEIYDTENHPNLMIAFFNLAFIYAELKIFDEVGVLIKKAYEIYRFNFPEGNPMYQVIEDTYRQVFKEG